MDLEFIDIKELRAKYLKDPVTLAYCTEPGAFTGNGSKEVNDFNPMGPDCMSSAQIICYRDKGESTVDAFHRLDKMMEYYGPPFEMPLIMAFPIQEVLQDPYDQTELRVLYDFAVNWADLTGAKIVLILDKSNTFEFYIKRFY